MTAKTGAQMRSHPRFCTGLLSVTALVLLSGHVASALVVSSDEVAPTLRLPADVEPKAYALALDVVPTTDTFGGKVTIRLGLTRARRAIWLHGQGMKVSAVKARFGEKEVVGTFTQASSDGLARVVLSQPVGPGDIVLTLDFSSAFNTRNDGFYKFVYAGESYAMTKFEALSARLAFPCFDEPAFKAPLTLTLQAPANLVVVANSAIEREELLAGGKKAWHFKATPPLPTYLYAWAVGPWDEILAPPVPVS
jgi:alanyl aminopeptidase